MSPPIALLLSHKGSVIHSVAALATVSDAVRVMNLHKVGSVLIMQGQKLAGIFTERDVLTRVIASGRAPTTTYVGDVMTRTPVTITPRTTVSEAMSIFTEKRCRRLPVLEETTGNVLGVISIGDVMRWLVDAHRTEAEHLRQYVSGSPF